MKHSSERVLMHAQWLGYLGLIPFVSGMVLMIVLNDSRLVSEAVHNYAAIILTFVGAIHWGRALNCNNAALMRISVIPSLIAWCSLFLAPNEGLLLTTVAFITMLFIDRTLYHEMGWFKRLRTRLSLVVSATLIVSWLHV